MIGKLQNEKRFFEIMMIVITVVMSLLLFGLHNHKMVILNLYFLPVVLTGYFLGRHVAGPLAIFSAMAVTIAISLEPSGFASYNSPMVVALAVTIWGAVLALTALMIGTLCDQRAEKVCELHSAYVGVVEVLAKYLESAAPRGKGRSIRVAELCQAIAQQLKLNARQEDDIRVGALLYDFANVEITTKLISKAVDTIEAGAPLQRGHTFFGLELVQSLEPVLSGAVPLLLNQDDAVHDYLAEEGQSTGGDVPVGAKIIRVARTFDALVHGEGGTQAMEPEEAINTLKADRSANHDPELIRALERCTIEQLPINPMEEAVYAV